jgi:hypothetical protein
MRQNVPNPRASVQDDRAGSPSSRKCVRKLRRSQPITNRESFFSFASSRVFKNLDCLRSRPVIWRAGRTAELAMEISCCLRNSSSKCSSGSFCCCIRPQGKPK